MISQTGRTKTPASFLLLVGILLQIYPHFLPGDNGFARQEMWVNPQ